MKKVLLTKEEILSFKIWEDYFNFLTSTKALFEKELAAKLNGEKIYSFVESKFYEKDGSLIKEGRSKEYPDAEEIHLEVENKEYSTGFSFYNGNTINTCLDFYSIKKDGEENYKSLRFIYDTSIDVLFSSKIVEAAVYWIQTGTIIDAIKNVVQVCNED